MRNEFLQKSTGWMFLGLGLVPFAFNMGYFILHRRLGLEYIDNRIFYFFNIACAACLLAAAFLILREKAAKRAAAVVGTIFMALNALQLDPARQTIKSVTGLSPDFRHVLAVKEDTATGESIYYNTYYWLFAAPKETLPYSTQSDFKVDWLTKDMAAVTYTASDGTVHQYIGTYGDRGNAVSYYYVAAQIQGEWQGEGVEVSREAEGLAVKKDGITEIYDWDNIVQFGTLAVVLTDEEGAAWTIGLGENFVLNDDRSGPQTGEIILYQATMEDNQPITLEYAGAD